MKEGRPTTFFRFLEIIWVTSIQ